MLIPLYDLYVVPSVRRVTGNERGFSLLQRLGVGLVLTVAGTAVAALVETRRLQVVKTYGLEDSALPVPMCVFWLVPQYSIMGIAQVKLLSSSPPLRLTTIVTTNSLASAETIKHLPMRMARTGSLNGYWRMHKCYIK